MSMTACSRPMNDVTCGGRLPGSESSQDGGPKSTGRPGPVSWKMRSGRARSRRRCSPRSTKLEVVVEGVARELFGRERHEDLAAVRRVHQAGGAIDRRTVVVAVAELGVTGVDTDAYPERSRGLPRLRS